MERPAIVSELRVKDKGLLAWTSLHMQGFSQVQPDLASHIHS
jgi:hypothetical protein